MDSEGAFHLTVHFTEHTQAQHCGILVTPDARGFFGAAGLAFCRTQVPEEQPPAFARHLEASSNAWRHATSTIVVPAREQSRSRSSGSRK